MSVDSRKDLFTLIYIYIYIAKYLSIRCRKVCKSRKLSIWLGGECVCILVPIMAPFIDQFSLSYQADVAICSLYPVKFSHEYL